MANKYAYKKLNIKPSVLISNKYKYIYCIIPKCGSSSIMKSILIDDYNCEFDNDDYVYSTQQYKDNKDNIMFDINDINIEDYQDYKIFVVTRNPYERFCSYINNSWNLEKYNTIFNKDTAFDMFILQIIMEYDESIKYDKYACPQKTYVETYKKKFGENIEIIDINELSYYYKIITNNELTINNTTNIENSITTNDIIPNWIKCKIRELNQKYE